MSTFRFTVGPWNVHEGNETFGPGIRPSIPLEEKIKKFAELGMAGVQRIGPLKQFFMDEARGMSGKLPELLKA